jgi:hypothetical protein
MKPSLQFLLLIAAIVVPQAVFAEPRPSSWGPVTNDVQIAITLKDRDIDKRGAWGVTLLVWCRNVSTNRTILIDTSSSGEFTPGLSFRVISPSGKDISPKPAPSYAGSGRVLKLTPGRTNHFAADLGRLCRFNQLGTYEVTVRFGGIKFEQVSNTLRMAVAKHGVSVAE